MRSWRPWLVSLILLVTLVAPASTTEMEPNVQQDKELQMCNIRCDFDGWVVTSKVFRYRYQERKVVDGIVWYRWVNVYDRELRERYKCWKLDCSYECEYGRMDYDTVEEPEPWFN